MFGGKGPWGNMYEKEAKEQGENTPFGKAT